MYKLKPHDYEIRHRDTFIGIKKDGETLPFHVTSVECPDGKNSVLGGKILSGTEWESFKIKAEDKSVNPKFPMNGAVNLDGGGVILLNRKGKRQWRISLYSEVVNLYDPFSYEREVLGLRSVGGIHNKGLLHRVFNHSYYTPHEAIKEVLEKRRYAAAFNKDWYVGIRAKRNSICLFRGHRAVGVVEEDGKIVIRKVVSFLEEEITSFGLEVIVK